MSYFGDLFEVSDCCYTPAIYYEGDIPICAICGMPTLIVYAEQTTGHETEPLIREEPVNNDENLDNNINPSS